MGFLRLRWYGLWRLCRDSLEQNIRIPATERTAGDAADTVLEPDERAGEPQLISLLRQIFDEALIVIQQQHRVKLAGRNGEGPVADDRGRYQRHSKIIEILHLTGFIAALEKLSFVGKTAKTTSDSDFLPYFLLGEEVDKGIGPGRGAQEQNR